MKILCCNTSIVLNTWPISKMKRQTNIYYSCYRFRPSLVYSIWSLVSIIRRILMFIYLLTLQLFLILRFMRGWRLRIIIWISRRTLFLILGPLLKKRSSKFRLDCTKLQKRCSIKTSSMGIRSGFSIYNLALLLSWSSQMK